MDWINVKDRLPQMKEGSLVGEDKITQRVSDPVLAYVSNGDIEIACYWEKDGFCNAKYGEYLNNVTYWMPLPEPPEDWVEVTKKAMLHLALSADKALKELSGILEKAVSDVNKNIWRPDNE